MADEKTNSYGKELKPGFYEDDKKRLYFVYPRTEDSEQVVCGLETIGLGYLTSELRGLLRETDVQAQLERARAEKAEGRVRFINSRLGEAAHKFSSDE